MCVCVYIYIYTTLVILSCRSYNPIYINDNVKTVTLW